MKMEEHLLKINQEAVRMAIRHLANKMDELETMILRLEAYMIEDEGVVKNGAADAVQVEETKRVSEDQSSENLPEMEEKVRFKDTEEKE